MNMKSLIAPHPRTLPVGRKRPLQCIKHILKWEPPVCRSLQLLSLGWKFYTQSGAQVRDLYNQLKLELHTLITARSSTEHATAAQRKKKNGCNKRSYCLYTPAWLRGEHKGSVYCWCSQWGSRPMCPARSSPVFATHIGLEHNIF